MTENASNPDDLLRRAASGDQEALAQVFALYRERLRQMVRLRLDRRLQGRLGWLGMGDRQERYGDNRSECEKALCRHSRPQCLATDIAVKLRS